MIQRQVQEQIQEQIQQEQLLQQEQVAEDYSALTVAQLKVELRSRGLKVSGLKRELVERLQQQQQQQQQQ